MQLSYDPDRNIAYLRMRDPTGTQVETVRLSDELTLTSLQMAPLYGIELLNANAQLRCAPMAGISLSSTR